MTSTNPPPDTTPDSPLVPPDNAAGDVTHAEAGFAEGHSREGEGGGHPVARNHDGGDGGNGGGAPPTDQLGRARTHASAGGGDLPVALDDQGRMLAEVPCLWCGYNLRGLGPGDQCPECGTAIAQSLRGDLLQFASPRWLGGLRLGITLIFVTILAYIVVGFAVGALSTAMGHHQGLSLLFLIPALINCLGIWKLTTPDPAGPARETAPRSRRLARWVSVASLVIGMIVILVTALGQASAGVSSGWIDTRAGIEMFAQAAGYVGLVALAVYMGALARRLPSRKFARQFRVAAWGLGLTLGPMFASGLVKTVYAPASAARMQPAHGGATAGAANPLPPAASSPPPRPKSIPSSKTTRTLPGGTTRTIYPAGATGSPNAPGPTMVEVTPGGTKTITTWFGSSSSTHHVTTVVTTSPGGARRTTTYTSGGSQSQSYTNSPTNIGPFGAGWLGYLAIAAAVLGATMLVFDIWGLVLLSRFHRKLKEVRRLATALGAAREEPRTR